MRAADGVLRQRIDYTVRGLGRVLFLNINHFSRTRHFSRARHLLQHPLGHLSHTATHGRENKIGGINKCEYVFFSSSHVNGAYAEVGSSDRVAEIEIEIEIEIVYNTR